MKKGCICQKCGEEYKVDIIVSDNIWEIIKPENKNTGAGLLCGKCIFTRLEDLNDFGAYKLELVDE